MRKCQCTNCGMEHMVTDAVAGKLAGMAIAGLLGGAATRHPVGAVLSALLGLAIGHVIDEEILPRCPSCGEILRAVAKVA